jgi:hypothetical protein
MAAHAESQGYGLKAEQRGATHLSELCSIQLKGAAGASLHPAQ